MISLRKVLLTASLAVLVTGGPQVAVAEGMPMMSTSSSAEIGHVQWDWWRNQTASSGYTPCEESMANVAKAPEMGPVAQNWWQETHIHRDTGESMMSGTSSELGNVPYEWWRYSHKGGHDMLKAEHC
ncbi:hypothetical protein GCM10009104_23270 [Marinobacterium maritimum]|uniref:Uncharacterized protein n=1 Tax=Marinobacterium maritimum TaxID=500162 RepID=A0ABN1I7N7_9GAMM